MSKEELQDKIMKGLCFRNDEKFGPSHVCRNKQLHLLLMTKDDLSNFVDFEDNLVNQEEDLEEAGQVLQLSVYHSRAYR